MSSPSPAESRPFLDHSFGLRWSRLVPEAIESDITVALAGARERIDALAVPVADGEALTFENTLLALEEATEDLDLAWGRVGHLDSVRNSDALREAHNAMLPKVSEFYAGIPLNEGLWKRVAAYADTHLVVDSGGPASTVRRLDDPQRVAELARMLAGLGESDTARAHARELLDAAQTDRDAP